LIRTASYRPLAVRRFSHLGILCLVWICIMGLSDTTYAQSKKEPEPVVLNLYMQELGGTEIKSLVSGSEVWLSVQDVFDFLKIRYAQNPGTNVLTGFLVNENRKYLIDDQHNQIIVGDKQQIVADSAILLYGDDSYLHTDLLKNFFELDCKFDFRSLSVKLFTLLELPAIRDKKMEEIHRNIGRFSNRLQADTILKNDHPRFRLGMYDWTVNSARTLKGYEDTRVNFAFGGVLAGGETTVALQYNNRNIFEARQQFYLWKYVNDHNAFLRQSFIGKIPMNSIASIFAPVVGFRFTNSPSELRRDFGTYRLTRQTQPGWMVELYVNNTLVNYTIADAAGMYSFDVPILYGNTLVHVKYYGPNGEQRMGEANISMPFVFIPKKKLEYNISAGLVEDGNWSKYSRAQFNYGFSNRITLGGGIEYLSSITGRKEIPFATMNFRISRNMLFSFEYDHGVKSSITGHYRTPSNVIFEAMYTKYATGQKAIYSTYLEERRASVSYPLRFKKFNTYSKLSVYQIILPQLKYTTAEALFSGFAFGSSINFTTYALFLGATDPYLYSNLALAFRMPWKIMFMPQMQYEYNNQRFISLKGELEKRVSTRGFINGFYEQNIKSNYNSVNIGFRWEFSRAQVGAAVRKSSNNDITFITSVRGSVVRDTKTGYIGLSSQPVVGKGGIILLTYLDINNNGIKDPGEPKLKGLRYMLGAGFQEESKRDTTLIIRNLPAYTSYLLTIDKNSFDDISWRIKHGTMSVEINPNYFRVIEVPVKVVGEVSGIVYIQSDKGRKVQDRVLINIYNSSGSMVAKTMSEPDGYYSYMGLEPGTYTIKPDAEQMSRLGINVFPKAWHIEIKPGLTGDIHKDLDIILTY